MFLYLTSVPVKFGSCLKETFHKAKAVIELYGIKPGIMNHSHSVLYLQLIGTEKALKDLKDNCEWIMEEESHVKLCH